MGKCQHQVSPSFFFPFVDEGHTYTDNFRIVLVPPFFFFPSFPVQQNMFITLKPCYRERGSGNFFKKKIGGSESGDNWGGGSKAVLFFSFPSCSGDEHNKMHRIASDRRLSILVNAVLLLSCLLLAACLWLVVQEGEGVGRRET